jgi:hypothetical protein
LHDNKKSLSGILRKGLWVNILNAFPVLKATHSATVHHGGGLTKYGKTCFVHGTKVNLSGISANFKVILNHGHGIFLFLSSGK